MNKLTIAFLGAFLLFSASSAVAQFSGGLEVGLPMGTFSDVAKVGFGASVKYEASIKDKLSWTGSAGFLSFGGNSFTVGTISGEYGSVSVIPIIGGIKYYFNEASNGLYASADLSINFISYSVLYPNSGNGNGYTTGTASTSRIGFAPGIGYRTGNWDFSGRFNLVSDFNYLGIRAAYIFGSK